MQRISREERLGRLQVELSNGRMVRLEQLRQFARPVIVAGTAEEVQTYMAVRPPLCPLYTPLSWPLVDLTHVVPSLRLCM
eukprot:5244478-Pyramimonas_sp.AAC.1